MKLVLELTNFICAAGSIPSTELWHSKSLSAARSFSFKADSRWDVLFKAHSPSRFFFNVEISHPWRGLCIVEQTPS